MSEKTARDELDVLRDKLWDAIVARCEHGTVGVQHAIDDLVKEAQAQVRAETEREIVRHLLEVSREWDSFANVRGASKVAPPNADMLRHDALTLRNAARAIESGRHRKGDGDGK